MSGPLALLLIAAATVVAMTGCESTKEKSARLEKQAQAAVKETGVSLGAASTVVRVLDSAVVQDANGTAVVVTVRNDSPKQQVGLPLLIDVRGATGASVFRNDTPGLAASLTSLPPVKQRGELTWVNDQVTATGTARSVRATVGTRKAPAPKGRAVLLPVIGTRLEGDDTSGLEATGTVTNTTGTDQRDVVLYAVGRKAGDVVAAGRAIIPRLAAGKRAIFHAFFIGDPTGSDLQVTAPVVAR